MPFPSERKLDTGWLHQLGKLALAAITSNPKYLQLNKKWYFSLTPSLMQRCSGWAAPLAALHQALTQKSRLFPSRECCSPQHTVSKFVTKGADRVSWKRHNCSQLPWPQNDTSICPSIRQGELSHMATHTARWLENTIQLCAQEVIWWPPGQRQTQPIPNTQPELSTGSPLLRETLSQGQQGLQR